MATKKRAGVDLKTLRRLAKDVYGSQAQVREQKCASMRVEDLEFRLSVFVMPGTALRDERLVVCHPDLAVARHMIKAALWAA